MTETTETASEASAPPFVQVILNALEAQRVALEAQRVALEAHRVENNNRLDAMNERFAEQDAVILGMNDRLDTAAGPAPKKARKGQTIPSQISTREPSFHDDDESTLERTFVSQSPQAASDARAEARAILGIFFAINDSETGRFVPAKIKPSFDAILSAKDNLFANGWDRLHGSTKDAMSSNAHFLASYVSNDFCVTTSVLKRVIGGQFVYKSLQQLTDLHDFDTKCALVHFASATTPSEKQRQGEIQKRLRLENDDVEFEQPKAHHSKKDTSMHIYGSYDSGIDAILSCVANFLAFAESVVEVQEWGSSIHNPAIVNCFHELATLFASADARTSVMDLYMDHSYLMLSVFARFYDVWSELGKIISRTNGVAFAKANPDTAFPENLFDRFTTVASASHTALSDLVTDRSLNHFQAPLTSFKIIHPATKLQPKDGKEKDGAKGGKKSGLDKAKAGHDPAAQGNWLLRFNNVKAKTFQFPPGLDNFCLHHAIKDMSCTRAPCSFPHVDYDKMPAAQQQLLSTCLGTNSTNPNFALAKCKSYETRCTMFPPSNRVCIFPITAPSKGTNGDQKRKRVTDPPKAISNKPSRNTGKQFLPPSVRPISSSLILDAIVEALPSEPVDNNPTFESNFPPGNYSIDNSHPKTYAEFLKQKVREGKLNLYSSSSPFGRASRNLSFIRLPDVNNILLIVLKSNLLSTLDLATLRSTTNGFQNLIDAFVSNQHQITDVSPLFEMTSPRHTQGNAFMALALEADLCIPTIISTLQGEYTGIYRDFKSIVNTLRLHQCPEHIVTDVERVYNVGAPASFNAVSTAKNFYSFQEYGNHPSATNHPEVISESINKELDRSYAIALPAWMASFIPNIHLSPISLLLKAGKKPRMIVDHSWEPSKDLESTSVNSMHWVTSELALKYGTSFLQYLIRIHSLRISYPNIIIFLSDDDISAAFRHIKYHPFIAGAFAFLANGSVIIPTAQTFGSTTSPSNYECLAQARSWLSQCFSSSEHSNLLIKHKEYLDLIKFDNSFLPEHITASCIADSQNPPAIVDGVPNNTTHHAYVDDTMYADTGDHIKQAIVASIESCFTIFGARSDNHRPCPLSLEKFQASCCSPIRQQLGMIVNSNTMCISLPQAKLDNLVKLLKPFHASRRQCSISEGAKLLGVLDHLGQHMPWLRHLYISVRQSFTAALRSAGFELDHSDQFIQALALAESHPDSSKRRKALRRVAKERAHALYHGQQHGERIWITKNFRSDIDLLLALSKDLSLWDTPIPHIIPRDPDYKAYCDSCRFGAGGFSAELGFMWHIHWPQRDTSLNDMLEEPDTHINLLEYLAILITYAIAQHTLRQNPALASHTYPTIHIFSDNTTACGWSYKAASSSNKIAKHITHIAGSLQLRARLGLHVSHIKGEDNIVADAISPEQHKTGSSYSDELSGLPDTAKAALVHFAATLSETRKTHHTVAKRQQTINSRQRFYLEWASSVGLGDDPLLLSLPIRTKNFVFACYVLHLSMGNTLLCKTIMADTVEGYLSAAVKLFTSEGHPNPTWDSNSSRVSTINDILLETRRWESVADRREPLTWEMVEYQQYLATKSHFLSLDATMADWFVVGMYTGFRLSEWAQPSSTVHSTNTFQRSRDGSSTAIIVSDVVFGHKGKEIFFTVTWRWQKNGQNGQQVTFAMIPDHPDRCPYRAMQRIVRRASQLKVDKSAPLAWYLSKGTRHLITDDDIANRLQKAAAHAHGVTDPEELSKWTSHSIRVGACVALHGSGAAPDFIKNRLRWRSEAFLMYLRNTPQLALQHACLIGSDSPEI